MLQRRRGLRCSTEDSIRPGARPRHSRSFRDGASSRADGYLALTLDVIEAITPVAVSNGFRSAAWSP